MPLAFEPEDPLVDFYEDDATPGRYHLDVRKLLECGGEPYRIIMACLSELGPEDGVVLHALFEPRPLLSQLERMGLTHNSERAGPDHWEVSISHPR